MLHEAIAVATRCHLPARLTTTTQLQIGEIIMAKARTFRFTASGAYYRRKRTLPLYLGDGHTLVGELTCTITRYGWQRNEYHRPHDAYMSDTGQLFTIDSVPTAFQTIDGKEIPVEYVHAFVPIRRETLRNRYPKYTEFVEHSSGDYTIQVEHGFVIQVTDHGREIFGPSSDPAELQAILGTNPARRGRPRKRAA